MAVRAIPHAHLMTHSGESLLRLLARDARLPVCDRVGGPVVMMATERQIRGLVAHGRVIGCGSQSRLKYLVFAQPSGDQSAEEDTTSRRPANPIGEDNQTYSRATREHAHVAAWSRRWGHSKAGVAA